MRTRLHTRRAPGRTLVVGSILFAVWLLSCNATSNPSPAAATPTGQPPATPTKEELATPTQQLTIQATASSDVVTALGPTPAPPIIRTRYTLSARLDYAAHHLSTSQTVAYVNSSPLPLSELLFVVEPNRQPDVFRLTGLTWADGQPVANYDLDDAALGIPLPEPLAPGAAITLSLSFELNLPSRPAPLGYTPGQTNLGDWYPFVPPYDAGRGWLVHPPGASGEHLVYDVADYVVDIALTGVETDVTVAASGLTPSPDKGQSHYQLDAARSFAWSAGARYHVLSETAGGTRVAIYVWPEHQVAGQAALRAVVDALQVYARRFAPYPRDELVVIESEFRDGLEYEGLFFLGQEYFADYGGDPQDYLTAIAVHETAHQWWYGLVGNDQATEPWLDEALAIYSELLFYEAVYPDLTDWWWEFRVTRFEPQGWVDSTIYDHDGFRPYVNAVYLRGALFVHELRNLVGDAVFFSFLRDYVRRNSLTQVTAADFFDLLAEHTQADLSALIAKYFQSSPLPAALTSSTGVVACQRPIGDYERIEIGGEVLNQRTAHMLDDAAALYDGPGDLWRITQGSYSEEEASSFGTHAGGGAVDISIRDPNDPNRVLRDEAHNMVLALRRAGFAAWFRDVDDLYPGSPMHIHAIAVGDRELSPEAQEQLTGPHGYFRGMDGLPHPDGPRPDPHGGPIVCDWMLELGYRDERGAGSRDERGAGSRDLR